MFTDKFLRLPFVVYDAQKMELHNLKIHEVESLILYREIDISEIVAYEEAIPANGTFEVQAASITVVSMKSGDCYTINLPINKFKQKINDFYEKNHKSEA